MNILTLNISKLMVLACLSLTLIVSCKKKKDDPEPDPQPQVPVGLPTIATIATTTADYDSLGKALARVPSLVAAASDVNASLTVFAPNNSAFRKLLQDLGYTSIANIPLATLEKVLNHHIVGAKVTSSQLTDGQFISTLGTPTTKSSLIARTTSGVKIYSQNSEVSTVFQADIQASNGVIHGIDKVLVPELAPGTSTIAALAIGSSGGANGLDSLVVALQRVPDLLNAASDNTKNLTVFAPTNTAFQQLLSALNLTKVEDIPLATLTKVLQYHIVDGVMTSSMISDGLVLNTLVPVSPDKQLRINASPSISFTSSATPTVTGGTVSTADIKANNGVVHVIDVVLVPKL